MGLVVFGLNHRTAPVAVREKFVFTQAAADRARDFFRQREKENIRGLALSTCNRVEIYFSVPAEADPGPLFAAFIAATHGLAFAEIEPHLYQHADLDAARHLYRVAAGIDSMVIGETQILGQVKAAYYAAQQDGTTDAVLNRLFESALRVGKEVRTCTAISQFPVSVSSVAVELAERIFETLDGKIVLVVGAGEMSELTCKHLCDHGAASVIVSSRNFENAQRLADGFHGSAARFEQLPELLRRADIVITQTASPRPIIGRELMRETMRARDYQNLFIIDIAVPRDVERECAELKNLYLFDIDDLGRIANQNQSKREDEVRRCETIIDTELGQFAVFLEQRKMVPLLKLIDEYKCLINEGETRRLLDRIPAPADEAVYRQAADRLANKLIHPFLKALAAPDRLLEELHKVLREQLKEYRDENK